MNVKSMLSGTGVAIITPFKNDFSIDFEALSTLIDYIIEGGVNFIVTLGTTGETPVLSSSEKKQIVDFAAKHINGRIPLVVGIGGNDTASIIDELSSYNLNGATAILSASPAYNKPSQEGIYQHYKAIAAASPKPILLYNVPSRTGRNMTAETTLRLAELPNIAGIKEASGDMQQCMEILKHKPVDFLVTSGDDALALPQIACGMDGVISVAANVYPALFSLMIKDCLINNFKDAVEKNNQLLEAYNLMFAENNPAGSKAFLSEMGIIKNVLRLPNVSISNALMEKVREYMEVNKSR